SYTHGGTQKLPRAPSWRPTSKHPVASAGRQDTSMKSGVRVALSVRGRGALSSFTGEERSDAGATSPLHGNPPSASALREVDPCALAICRAHLKGNSMKVRFTLAILVGWLLLGPVS